MSFDYDVVTEAEAQQAREFKLLPDGIYSFAVMEAKFKYSKSGNPMIELKLRICHSGNEYYVFDNLIGIKSMAWKTKHFCDTTGLQKEYEAKQFGDSYCINRRGTCSITTTEPRPKNDGTGGMWRAKNEVHDYLSQEAMDKAPAANPFAPAAPKAEAPSEPFLDDELPF